MLLSVPVINVSTIFVCLFQNGSGMHEWSMELEKHEPK
jgi:hypothetical protein